MASARHRTPRASRVLVDLKSGLRLERTYADAASSTNSAILPLDVPIWPQVPATVELVPALNGAFQRLWMYRWLFKGRLSLAQLAEVLEDRR